MRRVSMASGRRRSFAVAGSFSELARMSSSAAAFMASRRRATSSSAKESSTSSFALLRFLAEERFLVLRIASICMSRRILLAINSVHEKDGIFLHEGQSRDLARGGAGRGRPRRGRPCVCVCAGRGGDGRRRRQDRRCAGACGGGVPAWSGASWRGRTHRRCPARRTRRRRRGGAAG